MKTTLIILLALFLLGSSSCPTEPEDEKIENVGSPPGFPDVPEPE